MAENGLPYAESRPNCGWAKDFFVIASSELDLTKEKCD
jgi:hypothetical protein